MDFFVVVVPLPARSDGVKLGESTLNRFLLLFASLGRRSQPAKAIARLTYPIDLLR